MIPNILSLATVLGLLMMTVPSTTMAQSCPPAEALASCTCVEGLVLGMHCDGSLDQDIDLQGIFDRITPLVDQNEIFDYIVLTNLPPSYRQLPAHLTSLKFRQIQIQSNFELEYIHPEAFNGSHETVSGLVVSSNKLSNRVNQSDNFNFFAQFPNLQMLYLKEEYLEYIPSDPWPLPLPNLETLTLDLCGLVGVGSRILANLPNLVYPIIRYCDMPLEGFSNDTFEGITNPAMELDLTQNPTITHLPEAIFKPALDYASFVSVGGYICPIPPVCHHEKLSCDEDARWLCNNQAAYQPKLVGFLCDTDEEDYDVWDWCRDNPSH